LARLTVAAVVRLAPSGSRLASTRWIAAERVATMADMRTLTRDLTTRRLPIAARRQLVRLLTIACVAAGAAASAAPPAPLAVAMTPDRWDVTADAEFVSHRGVPSLNIKKGAAVLKGVTFGNGTIEFDVDPTGPMGAGAGFRVRDERTFEDFYLRPRPNCAEAWDCMQYAPQTQGVLLWDLYPQFQSPAPLVAGDWNRVKLVISGRRMRVYVNGTRTLEVGRLAGDALEGGILLQGPGYFTRMTVTPDATDGLSPEPEPDPAAGDSRFVTRWQLSPASALPQGQDPALTGMPAHTSAWRSIQAEAGGLVNVTREYGLPTRRPDRALTWLRTTISSDTDQVKRASIGWTREAWVFVNGKQVFADKNPYQPPDARKKPEGRCSLENGTVTLPLVKGRNEVVVALANDFYGWGLLLRLDDVKGLQATH
jgi:hypothetical protein